MAAITWRNVDAPSFQGASAILTGAQQSIDSGFNKFNELLKQRETMDAANWENAKQNNTQAFLDQLTQYRTPEELKAAQESGVLDRMRQDAGAQIDRAGIRGAEDARYGALQQRGLTNVNYTNTMLAEKFKPQTEAALAAAATGNEAGVNAILAANSDMPGQDKVRTALVNGLRAASAETRAVNQDTRAGVKQDSDIKSADALQGYYAANTEKILAEAAKTKTESSPEYVSSKKVEEAKKEFLKNSILGAGTADTADGMKELDRILRKELALSDNAVSDVMKNLQDTFPSGKYAIKGKDGSVDYIPVPVQAIADRVRGNPDWFGNGSLWSRQGDTAISALHSQFKNDEAFRAELAQAINIRDGKNAETLDKADKKIVTNKAVVIPNPLADKTQAAPAKPVLPAPQPTTAAPLFVNNARFAPKAAPAQLSPEELRKQLKEVRSQQYLNRVLPQNQ